PDAPSGVFVHWLLYGIPSTTNNLEEGQSITSSLPGTRQGRNGFGANRYDGPQPPEGIHRYFFRLFALDKDVALKPGSTRSELDHAMGGHILGEAKLMAQYRLHEYGSSAA